MSAHWRDCKIGELLRIKHGYAFKGKHFAESGEFVLLTPGNFEPDGGLKLKGEKEKYYDGDFPRDFLLHRDDMLVVMTDLTQDARILGSPAVTPVGGRFLHNQRLGKVVNVNSEFVDRRFLYHLFNFRSVREQIKSSATGATVRHTAPDRIYAVKVRLPPLPDQRRIASILSAYDDLIENNTRRIAILEEMARRLYEEWFVRFRFAGHEGVRMVESELGLVPEGWSLKKVNDIVLRLPSGVVYKQADVSPEGTVPVIDQSTSELLGFHDNAPAHKASADAPVVIFGDHTCKMQLMVTPFSLGPNTVPFVAKELAVHYIFWVIRGLIKTQEYKRHWSDLMKKSVIVAPVSIAQSFAEQIQSMAEFSELLKRKNRNLRTTRDLLLPKLISGELDVSTLPEPQAQTI